ncbi:MAG: hypothetical protein JNG86_09780 [Verrucomicrobiaceae bacterium]|nr:hypothetical protein [Verrucomicrobiaceae bacterium]
MADSGPGDAVEAGETCRIHMKKNILFLGIIGTGIAALASLVIALFLGGNGEFIRALGALVAMFVCLAQMVVFHHVMASLEPPVESARTEKTVSDLSGTPWENNAGFTFETKPRA